MTIDDLRVTIERHPIGIIRLRVRLEIKELNYLLNKNLVPAELERKLTSIAKESGENAFLHLTDEEADSLRDACGEQLQRIGFDKDYEPTDEGTILEDLIDKFFAG